MNKESVCHTVLTGRSGGLNPDRGKIFFSSSQHSKWLWDPPGIIFNGYLVYFSDVKREVDCAHLCSLPRLRINGTVWRLLLLYAVAARTGTVVALPYLIPVSKRIPRVRKCWSDCRFWDKMFQIEHICLMYNLYIPVFSVWGHNLQHSLRVSKILQPLKRLKFINILFNCGT